MWSKGDICDCLILAFNFIRERSLLRCFNSEIANLDVIVMFCFSVFVQEIVDWYMAIRAAKWERRRIAFPDRDLTQVRAIAVELFFFFFNLPIAFSLFFFNYLTSS